MLVLTQDSYKILLKEESMDM